MSSSESDDDCYGNVAQKLAKMKKSYKADQIESSNLLNDSQEIKVSSLIEKAVEKSVPVTVETAIILNDSVTTNSLLADNELDKIIAAAGPRPTTKRVTRSSLKKTDAESLITPVETTRKRGAKGRRSTRSSASDSTVSNFLLTSTDSQIESPRQRGRARRGRGRRRPIPAVTNSNDDIPTYSIGNTYEYPDQSESVQLFGQNSVITDEVVVIDEPDVSELNEELSVKVYWQNSEIFKFLIRKYQKITQIYDYFAKKENVSHNNLLLTYNEKIITPDDTPDTINYNIAKFIDGGIVSKNVSKLIKTSGEQRVVNGVRIKFQCQNSKKPYETVVGKDDKLLLAMTKCAEHFEQPLEKLKFVFDGDVIKSTTTPQELELEGGECIDVKILS